MATPHLLYKFAFPEHVMLFTYKIYVKHPFILEDDCMYHLLFFKVNVFSYILYGHSPSH